MRLPLNSPESVIVTVCASMTAAVVDWFVVVVNAGLPASDESESSVPDVLAATVLEEVAAVVGECTCVAPARGRLLAPGTTPAEWVASPVQTGGLVLLLCCSRVSIGVKEPAAAPMLGPAAFMATRLRLVEAGAVAAADGERSSGHTT